jgi:hypothetical protein
MTAIPSVLSSSLTTAGAGVVARETCDTRIPIAASARIRGESR